MAFWWANQRNNFRIALGQHALWTCPGVNGQRVPGRDCIKEMRVDDIVFHYSQREVRAVSRVTRAWHPARRPAKGYETDSDDQDDGWMVHVDPIADDLHLPVSVVADVVAHGRKYGPINGSGGVNRAYLARLEDAEGEALLDLTGLSLDTSAGETPSTWMEIRRDQNTLDFGAALHASREKEDGTRKPAFDRVCAVRPGDHVLHWWQKAIVGVSVVANQPTESVAAVDVALKDFVLLPAPITLDDVRAQTASVVECYWATRADQRWSQFPLQVEHADTDEPFVRGAPTTYFVAIPPSFIDVFDSLRVQLDSADLACQDRPDTPDMKKVAFESDPLRRKAVELHAEEVAIAILQSEGYTLAGRPGKPYDLEFVRGDEILHVEVKGSTIDVDTVILTRNEVSHAAEYTTTLFVVDRIEIQLDADGEYMCRNGRPRRWDEWIPAAEALTPLQHAYTLPPHRQP
ncbi:protein NO VEIN domain-containing protein [Gordonia sp. FQ]|uniref:protein NO VEIN domain-containing protein n=1 Tax=Gordonia sp. FQ TaxID=3446634 RepID=UPI003F8726C2